jgi:hypothetical protein
VIETAKASPIFARRRDRFAGPASLKANR